MLRVITVLLLMSLRNVRGMDNIEKIIARHPTWSFEVESVESLVQKGIKTLQSSHPDVEITEEMLRQKLTNQLAPGTTHILRKTGDPNWPKVVPQTFDAREKFKNCASLINDIDDEGPCYTDAHVIVSSIATDRYCIYTNGTHQDRLSSEYIVGCSAFCTKGPSIWTAWRDGETDGIPSGGKHDSNSGCLPYEHAPCIHTVSQYTGNTTDAEPAKLDKKSKVKRCDEVLPYDHDCPTKCSNKKYKTSLQDDLKKFTAFYFTSTHEYQMRSEIMTNGPIVSSIVMYSDFFDHKGGWYFINDNATLVALDKYFKLIGWGKESVNGVETDYWLAMNTWENWSDGKVFKISRGINYLWSEWVVMAATFDPL